MSRTYLKLAHPLTFAILIAPIPAMAQDLPPPPAGSYIADPNHAIVSFSVSHLGLSDFVATFDTVEARLEIDPVNPGAAAVTARLPLTSLDLPGGSSDFLATMLGPAFFDAGTQPEITFASESLEITGETEARISGTLTLRGIARPVTLAARYNGGYGAGILEPEARIGFSASTEFRRSEFGMDFGVPPEGSEFGVGDLVSVRVEIEFVSTTGN